MPLFLILCQIKAYKCVDNQTSNYLYFSRNEIFLPYFSEVLACQLVLTTALSPLRSPSNPLRSPLPPLFHHQMLLMTATLTPTIIISSRRHLMVAPSYFFSEKKHIILHFRDPRLFHKIVNLFSVSLYHCNACLNHVTEFLLL